jgi:hypothetical protein
MMRRDRRSTEAVEQAVEYGIDRYGDHFIVSVKPRPNGDATTVTRAEGATGGDGAESGKA